MNALFLPINASVIGLFPTGKVQDCWGYLRECFTRLSGPLRWETINCETLDIDQNDSRRFEVMVNLGQITTTLSNLEDKSGSYKAGSI